MDDHQLDDSVKRKVAQFEGEDYDPAAFSALRFRVESANLPFHVRYRTELTIGSALALVTLIILTSQWLIADASTEALHNKMKDQENQIAKLQQEIQHLKNISPDTIYIIAKDKNVYRYQYLLNRIATLESEMLEALENKSHISMLETEYALGDPEQNIALRNMNASLSVAPIRRVTRLLNRKSMKAEPRKSKTSERAEPQLSTKTMRDIEKHYHPGIGIKVGPTFEFSNANIKGGQGNLNTSVGILADLILSPSLSLESGIKYGHRDYTYDQSEVKNINLPATDQTLGDLKKAEIDSWLIEVPIALKYRYPFTLKTQGLASIGYSSFVFREQAFDYSYEYANNNDIFINAVHESKALKFYPGSFNISLGLSRQIKDQRLEASVGFQKGIQPIGLEKTRADFFNVRTVFWFTIK